MDKITLVAAKGDTTQEHADKGGRHDHGEEMSYHDNDIYLHLQCAEDQFTLAEAYGGNATYTVESYCVTPGQDPSGHVWSNQKHTLYPGGFFTFNLGRSGSDDVASWWTNRIKTSENTFKHNPGKLNFAFLGTLTVTLKDFIHDSFMTTTFEDVALAQGHAGSTNNWWFGGQGGWGKEDRNGYVYLRGLDSSGNGVSMEFQRGDGNNVNEFWITDLILPQF